MLGRVTVYTRDIKVHLVSNEEHRLNADSWTNLVDLLMHRLQQEAYLNGAMNILWESMVLTTTTDGEFTTLTATVEAQEAD